MTGRLWVWLDECREAFGEWLLEFSVLIAVFVPLDLLVLAGDRADAPHVRALWIYAALSVTSGVLGVQFKRRRMVK